MQKLLPTLAIVSVIGAPALVFAADNIVDVQKDAQKFVKTVSIANMFEIETSKVALARSANTDVKTFAQRMVDEHGKAGKDFKAAIAKSGLELTPNTTLDEEHQKKLEDLKKASADDFDDKYIDLQQDAHDKAVDVFDDYAKEDDANPALKSFAATTLPTLKNHKKEIEAIDKKD